MVANLLLAAVLAAPQSAGAGDGPAEEIRYGHRGWIEYVAGDAPLVISAPHGGGRKPEDVADRGWGVRLRDAQTQQSARALADAFAERTGRRPHLVLCHLHRSKLDANRPLREAAQGDPLAERAWREFHAFLEEALDAVEDRHGYGLYVDLHGHGHPRTWIELGYGLGPRTLAAERIADGAPGCTVRPRDGASLEDLIRGAPSIGARLQARGFDAVPGPVHPDPDGAEYFSGGYNVRRYHRGNGYAVDAVQFELPRAWRSDPEMRARFADAAAEALAEFLAQQGEDADDERDADAPDQPDGADEQDAAWEERMRSLRAALAAAVDEPDAEARADAAHRLATRRDVSLAEWTAAARGFGDFDAASPGPHRETVVLPVLDAREETEIHVYVPPGYDPERATPLLFALHGAGGSGRDMVGAWSRRAAELGMLVCAPSEAGKNEGYAFSARERHAAMAALRWMRRHYHVDEDRIHLHGVSRGGHMAWDLATRWPDRWASLSPAIGGPTVTVSEGRNNLRLVENVWHLPLRDLQGSLDDPLLLRNLRVAFARLKMADARDAELVEFPDLGHRFRLDAVDWDAFLGGALRDPVPERVLLRTARLTGRRVFWLRPLRLDRREVEEVFRIEVDVADWNSWDDARRMQHVQEMADARTAQIEAWREADGFHVETDGVERFALLLSASMLDDAERVSVRIGARTRRLRVEPSAEVLLADFVERFDRGFLPVAEVRVSE